MALAHSFQDLVGSASSLYDVSHESKFPVLRVPAFERLLPDGIQRGAIFEITGLRSSGRSAATIHLLAQATARGEVCALVDLYGCFDPVSAKAAGMALNWLVWVRCRGKSEHALRATDLLVHAGGFGIILLDLCEARPRDLNRIPISYWHRFRRAVENTPTILLVLSEAGQAKSCRQGLLGFHAGEPLWSGIKPFLMLQDLKSVALSGRSAEVKSAAVSFRL